MTGTVVPKITPILKTLISFDGIDGKTPDSGVIADSNGDLIGTTAAGGANGDGEVFEVTNIGDAAALAVLASYSTTGAGTFAEPGLISDAAGDLFGEIQDGGPPVSAGQIFELINDGSDHYTFQSPLFSFNGVNGRYPVGGLTADSAGDLFGTTDAGGTNNDGIVFELIYNGKGKPYTLNTLWNFTAVSQPSGVILNSLGDLLGTTSEGGTSNKGTVFELVRQGGTYVSPPTTLVNFNGNNGAKPLGGLIADAAGDLFGTTGGGGTDSDGTIFELINQGGGAYTFHSLASFNFSNGQDPSASLLIDNVGDLFGTTFFGGANNDGNVFELAKIDGTYASAPSTVVDFAGNNGSNSISPLIADSSGDLFGTTDNGGANNDGTVFEITGSGFVPVAGTKYLFLDRNNGLWSALEGSGVARPVETLPGVVDSNFMVAGYGRAWFDTHGANTRALDANQLWVSDGTAAGTKLVVTFPDPANASSGLIGIEDIVPLPDGNTFFDYNDSMLNPFTYYITDGTTTAQVSGVTGDPALGDLSTRATEIGGSFFFLTTTGLWSLNEAADSATLIKSVNIARVAGLAVAGNKAFFAGIAPGSGSTLGTQLWVTDGTTVGTRVVTTLPDRTPPGSTFDDSGISHIAPLSNGKVLLAYSDGTGNGTLYLSDGTSAGTVQVAGYSGFANIPGGELSGKYLFTDESGLWAVDEAAGSVTRLATLNGLVIQPTMVVSGGKVWFQAKSAGDPVFEPFGDQLWASDGTLAGTGIVKQFAGGGINNIIPLSNGHVALNGGDTLLNESDGTSAGTISVADFAGPGLILPFGTAFEFGGSPLTPPSITGTTPGQPTQDTVAVRPFAAVTVTDPNSGQTETITVTLSAAANGVFSNLSGGTSDALNGVYTISGTASAVTAALDNLVFLPTPHQAAPGMTVTTTFTIRDVDTGGLSASDATTTVIATETVGPAAIGPIYGADYGPFRNNETPNGGPYPTQSEIDADTPILGGMANTVRVYSVSNGFDRVVRDAISIGLQAIPSAYLSDPTTAAGLAANQAEINNLVNLLNDPTVDLSKIPFVVVGSEFLLNNPTQYNYLVQQIQDVRSRVPAGVKITTAESWYNYLTAYPGLASQVDLIFANILPFWEPGGIPLASAPAFVAAQYDALVDQYSNKNVVISETGWPSAGTNGAAVGTVANEEAFWSQFIPLAQRNGINFLGFEAFDEPWKVAEGPPGTHWGLYDELRTPKGTVTSFNPLPRTISTNGVTTLKQVANEYELDNSGGTGPRLIKNTHDVIAGEIPASTPIAAAQLLVGGYEVAWKVVGADKYFVWSTDTNGNFTGVLAGVVSGTSTVLEDLEVSFKQDLNGDGTIGSKVIAPGPDIWQVGINYVIGTSLGSGVLLRYQGSPVTTGQFGASVTQFAARPLPLGGGYEVAWQVSGANLYFVWDTDANGNFVYSPTSVVPGGSGALEALEPGFNTDLDGDNAREGGETAPTTPGPDIWQFGSYYLIGTSPASGVLLQYQGNLVTAGQFGASVVPIAARLLPLGGGYEVAWQVSGTNLYFVWDTDANGNFVSSPTGAVSGGSGALEALEPGFNTDLDGDGASEGGEPAPTTPGPGVWQFGNYYLIGTSPAAGVLLQYQGHAVTSGQFGAGIAPIAAATLGGGGYEVAWQVGGTNQYFVWDTDTHGNFVSSPTGVVSGQSFALEDLETTFGADLNSDGTIGLKVTATPGPDIWQVGINYVIGTSLGSGVLLRYQGSPVTTGQFGASVTQFAARPLPLGGGYEVAWQVSGANLYFVWDTDANGNFVYSPTSVVPGGSGALEALEPGFNTDLDGDNAREGGETAPTTPGPDIWQFGSYYLIGTSPASGVLLQYQGNLVTAGQFGASVVPIAARLLPLGGGYEVAWQVSGTNLYFVWDTDANGNFVSSPTGAVSGGSGALEALEPGFNTDLDGDGASEGGEPAPTTPGPGVWQFGNYYLIGTSPAAGVLLQYQGHAVTSGQFGAGIAPIAAATLGGGGYEVAWQVGGTNQYFVWDTDTHGNFVSSPTGVVSGQSFALEDLETTFGADLNGDGRHSAQLITTPQAGGALDLSGQVQSATVNLGPDLASAAVGLNVPSLAFIGAPDAITLGPSSDIVEYAMTPSSGIETISGFVLGQDLLNIDLMAAASGTLRMNDTQFGASAAIAITSSTDTAHGVVLLGLGSETAADLLAAHTTFRGGHALVG